MSDGKLPVLPPLFKLGLEPLAAEDWLFQPEEPAHHMALKHRLIAERPKDVFVAEGGTEDSQQEALTLIEAHLGRKASAEGRRTEPPLLLAARMIADDLVIMRRGEAGWRLVAACVCFPSSWNLRAKFSKPMGVIHQEVPGFAQGMRPATIIERIFDRLSPEQLLLRWNWSLYKTDELHHPEPAELVSARDQGVLVEDPYVRTERQTLRKLAGSGDVLFAIGVEVKPISAWPDTPQRREVLAGLAQNLDALTSDELNYKGLSAVRDRLSASLRSRATGN
ncbi:MAG: DUF3445 domain-containing protein [Pseudomonadota bacterium]